MAENTTVGQGWRINAGDEHTIMDEHNQRLVSIPCGGMTGRTFADAAKVARLIAAAPDLLAALQALEDAQTALNDADEHSEQAEAEGWRNDPTGSGWVSESYNRASKLFDKATELRRAALLKASPRAGEGV